MRAVNPYNYNMPVGPEMFFGRQGDVETLKHHLTVTPGDSFALIGGRRMGKTSLLEALLRALKPLTENPAHGLLPLPIHLDLSGEGIDSVIAFFRTVGERAQDVLADLLVFPPTDALAVGEKQPPAPAFGRVLKSWGQTAMEQWGGSLRLILLLDECEQIVDQPWAPDLYGTLRYLVEGQVTRPLLKVVMAGSHRFLTQVRQRGSPLRNVLKYHRLRVLDDLATRDLVAQPTGSVLPEEVVQAVVRQSGGHPFLTQYLMHHLWERGLERATSEAVRRVAEAFPHDRPDFRGWTDGLGDSCLRIYGVLAQTREALTEARVRAALRPCPQDLPQALDALCYHGLVVWEADGRAYRVAGQMFREWFAANVAERLQQVTLIEQPSEMPQVPKRGQEEPMNTLTWLHISDLHFRTSQTYDANIVLRPLLRDVAERIEQDDLRLNFIAVTGDIAFSGKPTEYNLARSFFDDLLRMTGLPHERLFLVPGNHDVDRSLISRGAQAIGDSLTDRGSANAVLSTPDDRRLMFARFKGYATFVNDYLSGHLCFNDEHHFYVHELDLDGRRIAFLGLNSAWLSASDEDKANGLLIGERQARATLEQAEGANLKIVLLHHPFDWLREFDQNDSATILLDNCDFILHGHLHRTTMTQLVSPDSGAMVIAAGACYETREYPNSYNFVRLDFTAGTGTVYLRRYSDERGGFWAKDTLTYRNVPDGVYTFALHSRLTSLRSGLQPLSAVGDAPASQGDAYQPGDDVITANGESVFAPGLNLDVVRRQLNQVFDDPGFDAFCLSHFPEVYDRFSRGMRKDEKITLLLDYCRRTSAPCQKLLSALKEQA